MKSDITSDLSSDRNRSQTAPAVALRFNDIITFQFAAAFSAFGCTTADYLQRYSQSVEFHIPTGADRDGLMETGEKLNQIWTQLAEQAIGEMGADGHAPQYVICEPFLMMRYTGQLEDIEVFSPVNRVSTPEDMQKILDKFEEVYAAINHRVSRYGDVGISIMELGLTARTEKVKPRLIKQSLRSAKPAKNASRGQRPYYYQGSWHAADLWEMDSLQPGNEINGPAVIEHPATTLVVHPGDEVFIDEWTILHYRHG